MKTSILGSTIALIVISSLITDVFAGKSGFTLEHDGENESALTMETWMTDKMYFQSSILIPANEPALSMETWMTDKMYFQSSLLIPDNEPALNMETWMTDKMYFRAVFPAGITGQRNNGMLDNITG
jgi:hypothetical protein